MNRRAVALIIMVAMIVGASFVAYDYYCVLRYQFVGMEPTNPNHIYSPMPGGWVSNPEEQKERWESFVEWCAVLKPVYEYSPSVLEKLKGLSSGDV